MNIEKDSRVSILVDKSFSKEEEITGRVVFKNESECVIELDPKYQETEWGWKAEQSHLDEFKLNDSLLGHRLGITPISTEPAKSCKNTIKKVLPSTSQRRL